MNQPADARACFAAASVFSHEAAACQRCRDFLQCSEAVVETLQRLSQKIDVSDLLRKHKTARLNKGGNQEPIPVARIQPMETIVCDVEKSPKKKKPVETIEYVDDDESVETEPIAAPVVKSPALSPLEMAKRKTRVAYASATFTSHEEYLLDRTTRNTRLLAESLWSVGLTAALIGFELRKGNNPCDASSPSHFNVICELLLQGGLTQARLRSELEKRGGKGGKPQSPSTASSYSSVLFSFFKLFNIAQETGGQLVLVPACGCDNGSDAN